MLATQIGISWVAKPCQLPQVLTKSLWVHSSRCHSCVRYSPRTSDGEASTANPSAHRSCSGIARHKGCQPVRIDLHMDSRNSGYSTRCWISRASHGANTRSIFMFEKLACMLLAYSTFESAT